ncbi:MAG: hypothetical protein O7F71_04305 [Gammaproteobacteria bacterium]|nr:hypothetical protein [Gammaproteobacteria bacterium]
MAKIPVSDLLAHRDGEHIDPELSAEIEADPESRVRLQVLREIKHALNELPGIDPADEVWQNIEQRLRQTEGLPEERERQRQRGSTWRHSWANLATAATVFFAAALSILWFNPMDDGVPEITRAPLSDLVLRSQQLESRVFYPQARSAVPAGQVAWNSSQQALLYRIADVDSELQELQELQRNYEENYEEQMHDPEERERLWRQRVELLESLIEVQRRQQPSLRMALY